MQSDWPAQAIIMGWVKQKSGLASVTISFSFWQPSETVLVSVMKQYISNRYIRKGIKIMLLGLHCYLNKYMEIKTTTENLKNKTRRKNKGGLGKKNQNTQRHPNPMDFPSKIGWKEVGFVHRATFKPPILDLTMAPKIRHASPIQSTGPVSSFTVPKHFSHVSVSFRESILGHAQTAGKCRN